MLHLTAAIVDDSRVARQAIMQALRESGLASFTFLEASDGLQALEVLDAERVDILFLDWNLPHLDGPGVMTRMRHNRRTADIPVVMVTSERSLGKVMQAVDESEVDGYVCKPFTAEDVKQRITVVFDDLRRGKPRASTRKDKKPSGGSLLSRLFGRK